MTGHKILAIDGDAATRHYVSKILRDQGHTVLVAASGEEGLKVAAREQPELIIADPLMADLPGEELAARLHSDPATARIPLIALSHNPRTARLRSFLDSGFDDYLIKSPQVVDLLKASIAELLESENALQQEGGKLIVFISAKGGVGTSSFCVNLASCIAQVEPKPGIVVMDLVLPMGSMAEIVGFQGPEDMVTICEKPLSETTPDFFQRRLPRMNAWRFQLLAGVPQPDQSAKLNFVRIRSIVSALRTAYDYVLVDLGRALSKISIPLIQRADLVVITTSTDLTSIALTKTLWGFLQTKRLDGSRVFLILNRVGGIEGLTKVQVEDAVGLPIRATMPFLGENLSLTNNQHKPYPERFPTDTGTIILTTAARQIVEAAAERSGR
jgi:pilus assembly protein CpaE